ncbi:MAG: thioredoxin [Bacilli bacterium]|nr:thioredoxin [Bacilli bacterium]
MIKHLNNSSEFENEVKEGLVIVDFFADWCGPCQMLAPVLEEFEKETSMKIVKINVDEIPDLARQFRIMSIPTLMLFKDGKFTKKELGFMPIERLREFVK